jgi:hypothetical protein
MFAPVFDGWTLDQSHYLGVFATFPDEESTTGYKMVLLSFLPMTNEESSMPLLMLNTLNSFWDIVESGEVTLRR